MSFTFGLLCYRNSINLGDDIQSIAAKQILSEHNINNFKYLIDRDSSKCFYNDVNQSLLLNEISTINILPKSIHCLLNCWADGNFFKFPLNSCVDPLWISFHVNEALKDSTYKWLDQYKNPFKSLVDPENHPYYVSKYGVGCRDQWTYRKFLSSGFDHAYFSSCLTTTLRREICFDIRTQIYIVDVDESLLTDHVPKKILRKAKHLSHVFRGHIFDQQQKFREAEQLLKLYQNAKLVITSRLHCCLPCLAYKTPVVFCYNNMQDVRLLGLIDNVPVIGKTQIDWDKIENVLPENWNQQVELMRNKVAEWVNDIKDLKEV